jgi:hypothetical protein
MWSVGLLKNLIISAYRICKMATKLCASYLSHIEHCVLVTKSCVLSFIEANKHYTVSFQCYPRSYIVFLTNISVRSEILETAWFSQPSNQC